MLKYHIQTIEVPSGGATAIVFSGIPQTFDDLHVVSSLRAAGGSLLNGLRVEFNSNTSSVYSVRNLQAIYSSGPNSNSNPYNTTTGMVLSFMPSPSQTANNFSNTSFYVPNYSSSTQSKSVSAEGVSENNSDFSTAEIIGLNISAGLFANNSPITSIRVATQDGNALAQHSSISLYGIKRGSDGRTEVASGGTITTSGGFTIHTFNTSGTFVANRGLNVECLVVAGGGGGGASIYSGGGGGGAGGYRAATGLALSAGTSYAVTVGAGGTGGSSGGRGTSGAGSSFAEVASAGGGGGSANEIDGAGRGTGLTGGSGGGGFVNPPAVGNIPSVTPSQGNAGGRGYTDNSSWASTGGGGGASAVGQNGSTTGGPALGGAGGAGAVSSITGTSVTRAGGGGGNAAGPSGAGGAGGAGGGGAGVFNSNGVAGTANTGGGGGGAGAVGGNIGGAGGSGIVIIRYLTPA